MKFYGDALLQQNYLKEAVIPLDENFPVSPRIGQLVFSKKILYICVDIVSGLPYWVPLTQTITSYTHYQGSAASTWSITHNLNTPSISVTVYDTLNRVSIPSDVTVVDANNVTVEFGSPFTGSAVIISGFPDGLVAQSYAFEFYQSTPSDTWVVNHGLGRYPIVRVFIGNQEVQPASVTFTSINTVTLTISSPQVGQVKLL